MTTDNRKYFKSTLDAYKRVFLSEYSCSTFPIARVDVEDIDRGAKCKSCNNDMLKLAASMEGFSAYVATIDNADFYYCSECLACAYGDDEDPCLIDVEPKGDDPATINFDEHMFPRCAAHPTDHRASIPSFSLDDSEKAYEFSQRWGFVVIDNAHSPQVCEQVKQHLQKWFHAIQSDVNMSEDNWHSRVIYAGKESFEFGVIDRPVLSSEMPQEEHDIGNKCYRAEPLQDLFAWNRRMEALSVFSKFFEPNSNIMTGYAPYLTVPKGAVTETNDRLRVQVAERRLTAEDRKKPITMWSAISMYTDAPNTISMMPCPREWTDEGVTYRFQDLLMEETLPNFGIFDANHPLSQFTVPVALKAGQMLVFAGYEPFKIRSSDRTVLGQFHSVNDMTPKKSTTNNHRATHVFNGWVPYKQYHRALHTFPAKLTPPTLTAPDVFEASVYTPVTKHDLPRLAKGIFGTKYVNRDKWPEHYRDTAATTPVVKKPRKKKRKKPIRAPPTAVISDRSPSEKPVKKRVLDKGKEEADPIEDGLMGTVTYMATTPLIDDYSWTEEGDRVTATIVEGGNITVHEFHIDDIDYGELTELLDDMNMSARPTRNIGGKIVEAARVVRAYGEDSTYGGLRAKAEEDIPPVIRRLMNELGDQFPGTDFNQCIAICLRDGRDTVNPHRPANVEGQEVVILSVGDGHRVLRIRKSQEGKKKRKGKIVAGLEMLPHHAFSVSLTPDDEPGIEIELVGKEAEPTLTLYFRQKKLKKKRGKKKRTKRHRAPISRVVVETKKRLHSRLKKIVEDRKDVMDANPARKQQYKDIIPLFKECNDSNYTSILDVQRKIYDLWNELGMGDVLEEKTIDVEPVKKTKKTKSVMVAEEESSSEERIEPGTYWATPEKSVVVIREGTKQVKRGTRKRKQAQTKAHIIAQESDKVYQLKLAKQEKRRKRAANKAGRVYKPLTALITKDGEDELIGERSQRRVSDMFHKDDDSSSVEVESEEPDPYEIYIEAQIRLDELSELHLSDLDGEDADAALANLYQMACAAQDDCGDPEDVDEDDADAFAQAVAMLDSSLEAKKPHKRKREHEEEDDEPPQKIGWKPEIDPAATAQFVDNLMGSLDASLTHIEQASINFYQESGWQQVHESLSKLIDKHNHGFTPDTMATFNSLIEKPMEINYMSNVSIGDKDENTQGVIPMDVDIDDVPNVPNVPIEDEDQDEDQDEDVPIGDEDQNEDVPIGDEDDEDDEYAVVVVREEEVEVPPGTPVNKSIKRAIEQTKEEEQRAVMTESDLDVQMGPVAVVMKGRIYKVVDSAITAQAIMAEVGITSKADIVHMPGDWQDRLAEQKPYANGNMDTCVGMPVSVFQ
jgi:hypothetical protein